MKIIATTLAALCLALPATANNAAHTVTFRKMNGTVLQKVEVAHGGATVAPAGPDESADGLTFQRWDGAEKLSCVTNDMTCWALYEAATAKSPSTSIASSSIANRETPYSLDEYFQLYNTLAWSDEFSGSSLSIASGLLSTGKNWNYDTEQRNNELHTYTTDGSNQTVSDGTLKLTAKLDGGSLTSCSIKSNGRVAFKYGRCEIRTKITKTKGMFPAFWMMSNGQTWQNGVEVDVFEQVCGSDWLAANYHIVYQDNSTTQNQTPVTPNDGVHWGDGFHRIGVIVNEREIVYYVDDYIFKRIDVRDTRYDRLRSYPLYIILNLAVGGNWTAAMSGDLSVSSIGDLPAGFTSEDFTIDYCRIFTNATEGKTVARPAEPEGTTLSGPVKATVWRGWQMNSGKSGSEYYKAHLAGTERRHVKTALSEYFTRDKPDIVTFLTLPKITLWNAEKEGEFDIPGTTTLFASANGDGEGAREILMNAVMFDSTRFSASDSGVNSLTISDDKAYTNCVAICANLVERESGASVKVVSVNVLSTNDYANLFQTLNSFKDERAIVLFQGFNNTYFMNDAKKKAAAQLQSPYRLLDSVNGPWPSYFFAYATECVSADTEVPAPLSVPKANGLASGVHTNQAFCAMVRFEAEEPEPTIEYGPLDTSAFSKRMTVTFGGIQDGVTLTNFPVLVKLSEAIDGFDYGDFAAMDGGDLRFADSDGNLLPHEIDTWNTNGVSTAWVKVPALSQNATITACWGCANPPTVAPKDVWDDDYVGVWHLGEKLLPMKESSETTSDFTTANGTGIAFAAAGIVGGSVDFSSGSNCSLVAPDHDLLDGFDKCTFEVWTWQDALGTNLGILSKRNSYQSEAAYYIMQSGSQTPLYMATNSVAQAKTILAPYPSAQEWNHLAYAIDTTTASDNVRSYKNGGAPATATKVFPGAILSNARDLVLGNLGKTAANPFNGLIDEVRISKCVRSADWIKATHDTIALANFATYSVDGSAQPSDTNLADLKLKASTDKSNPIDYAVGETIRFDFRLDGVEALPSSLNDRLPLCVVWNRTGDDGIATKGTNVISLAQGCSMSTSLSLPGCVRVEAYLAGSNGQKLTYATSSGDTASITFSGGAGVATERMQLSAEEPANFDAFWAEAKAKLAAVPFGGTNVVLEEVFPANASSATLGAYHFYAAKIPCLGPRPVTGWLVVPKNAAPGSLAVRATFAGYGCATAAPSPPNWGSPNEIRFEVNAHGYDLVGQNDQYYQNFNDSINKTGRTFGNTTYTYGLAPQDYDNPTNTYFYYMALRVVRAFDYLKSRPEWDGTNVVAEGGSQGGLQTMWAGGLVDGISRIKPSITWGCDIGCPWNGQGQFVSRGWGIPCVPGAYYFDAALHARRVPTDCTAVIERIGMGDYTCPPRGVLLSYHNMKCQASATLVQGSTHGYVPPQPNQTFVITKAAVTNAPVAATEAEGLDWTNRLFTVSGLEAGVTVTLTLAAPDGTTITTLSQAADAGGNVSFSPATIPGALHDYTLSAGGETIASGSFMTGAWDAEGTWFSAAPNGVGGSTELGGTWTIPPEKTNATAYVIGSATAFSLTESARAVGRGKFIRAISALRYDFLNDPSDTFSDLALGDSLAAITAVKGTGGAAQWKACVGDAWIALDGAIAPAPDTDYLVRLEGDFTRAAPRVRLSVSDDGGASYAPLSSAATGDEWLVPNNSAATALTGIATDGTGNVAALRGQLSNAWVAEAGGVRYASLAEALRAAGRGGTVTLLTSATAPASLAAGRTIVNNGHIFVTYNDWRGTLFFMQ